MVFETLLIFGLKFSIAVVTMLVKQRHGWKGDLVRSVESLQVLVVEYALVTQNRLVAAHECIITSCIDDSLVA